MQIIMLSGKARVGKTWLAKEIANYAFSQGQIPVLLSLADGIKDAALEQNLTKEDNPKEYREFCQKLGVNKRNEDRDYWVNVLRGKINEHRYLEAKSIEEDKKYWERIIIIDDVRFMNEVAFGRELNATQIFLSSGRRTLIDSHADWREHESEALANSVEANEKDFEEVFQYYIINEGSQEELIESLEHWIPKWCGIEHPKKPSVSNEDCDCAICTAKRNNYPVSKEDVIAEFLEGLADQIDKMEGEIDDESPPEGYA